jgi:hypothetical protein
VKKQVKKNQGEKTSKLSFKHETIRRLTDAETKVIVGGFRCPPGTCNGGTCGQTI